MADAKDAKKKEPEKKEAEAAPAPAVAAKPAGGKKTMLIAGGVVLLLVAIGVPVAMFSMKSAKKADVNELSADAAEQEPQLQPEGAHDEEEASEGEEALGAFFPFENFVVNLKERGYVRAQIQLEFNNKDVPKRFYARMVPARDAIIGLLANRSQQDLLDEKGKETLKSDIKDAMNDLLKKQEVKNVYFTQFFVQ